MTPHPLDRPIGRPSCAGNTIAQTTLMSFAISTQFAAIYSTLAFSHFQDHLIQNDWEVSVALIAVNYVFFSFILDKNLQRGNFHSIILFDRIFGAFTWIFYAKFFIILLVCIYERSFIALFVLMMPSYIYLFFIRYAKRAKAGCRRLDPSSSPDQWETDNIGLSVKQK